MRAMMHSVHVSHSEFLTGAFCIHCRPVIDQKKHVDQSHLTLLNLSIGMIYAEFPCHLCTQYQTRTEPFIPPGEIHYQIHIDFAEYFSRKNQI